MVEYTISEIIVDYLIAEGVEYAFGVPGHGCTAFTDVFCDRAGKIKPIMVRHEQGAVHAADGFYRASGRPAICFTSIGPGATNLVTGLATAYVDPETVPPMPGKWELPKPEYLIRKLKR